MTIKYLDSKRISALSGDFIGTSDWTTSNSSSIGISGNEITIQERNGDYDEVAYKSFTALGADASFTFRFPIKITTIDQTGGTDSIRVVMGVSSASDIADSTARDEVGIIWRITNSINKFYAFTADGTALTSHYSGTDFATTPSTTGGDGNGNYYVEISGSGGTYTFKLFSDPTYDTLIESESITDAGITGLQYYVFRTWELTTHSNQARATVTISDKPTNVQDNSILVEKDTGKRYWSSGYGTGGAITKDSSVNTQTATSGSTLTASLTVASNSNRVIILSLTSYISPALVPTGITFGSQSFTKLDEYGNTDGNGSIWYLVNPNVGTDTVTATWASSIGKRGFTAYSFYNVAQTNPLSGFTTATGTSNVATGSITPTATGSAIFSSISWLLGGSAGAHAVPDLDGEYYLYTGGKGGASSYNLTPTIGSANSMGYTSLDNNGGTSESSVYKIGMVEIKKGNSTWSRSEAPYNISGLYAWYDGNDTSTVTKDGSNLVSKWVNKEGTTSRDIIQDTSGDKPTWVSANQNGKNLLNFAGNSFMNSATTLAAEAAPITAFFACKLPAAGGSDVQFIMSNIDGVGGTVFHPLYVETDDSIRFSNTTGGTVALNDDSLLDSFVYCTSVSNGTSGFMRLNGSLETTSPSSPIGTSGTLTGMSVGRYDDVGIRWWNDLIGEIIIYNRLLSASEIDTIESYLKSKWGL